LLTKFGQRHSQPLYSVQSSFDDQLEGDDFVARPEDFYLVAVPGGVGILVGIIEIVSLYLLTIVNRPDVAY
jgi:hypothetical protein